MAEGKVYNVRINSESARLVEEKQSTLGKSTAVNEADVEAEIELAISATETKAITVSSGSPGVLVNFDSPAAKVKIGSVLVFIPGIHEKLVWGKTREETINLGVSTTVVVPKKSRVTCEYVATIGTFSIPFSYTLEDKNTTSEHTDGVFTVVQYYDFNLNKEFQPL